MGFLLIASLLSIRKIKKTSLLITTWGCRITKKINMEFLGLFFFTTLSQAQAKVNCSLQRFPKVGSSLSWGSVFIQKKKDLCFSDQVFVLFFLLFCYLFRFGYKLSGNETIQKGQMCFKALDTVPAFCHHNVLQRSFLFIHKEEVKYSPIFCWIFFLIFVSKCVFLAQNPL